MRSGGVGNRGTATIRKAESVLPVFVGFLVSYSQIGELERFAETLQVEMAERSGRHVQSSVVKQLLAEEMTMCGAVIRTHRFFESRQQVPLASLAFRQSSI